MINVNSSMGITESSLPTATIVDQLAAASSLGFGFMEMEIYDDNTSIKRLDWTRAQYNEFNCARVDNGISVPSIRLSALRRYPLGHSDHKRRVLGLELVRRAISFCSIAGIKIIRLPDCVTEGEAHTDENDAYFLQNLCNVASMAAQGQVFIACPVNGDSHFFTTDRFLKLQDVCACPWMVAYPDLGRLFNTVSERVQRNKHVMDIYRSLSGVQLCDYNETGNICVHGNGMVDFDRIFDMLRVLDYKGVYLLDFPSGSSFEEICAGKAQMVAHLSSAGSSGSPQAEKNPFLMSSFIKMQM